MHPIVERILAGDPRAVARLIREIDDGHPRTWDILRDLHPHTGRACIMGVTGPPGAGKSTLVDQMIERLRHAGKTVGVLAVDPTSPFTGGATLGDRVRMQRHIMDDGVFIHSLATRGHLGGLTRSARAAIRVLDAMGKDMVIVETVGVGQDEVEVASSAHTTIVVTVPGMGDDVQAIKAGILEAADILVVNKSDREGADVAVKAMQFMAEVRRKRGGDDWSPPIVKTQAILGEGIDDLMAAVERHRRHLEAAPHVANGSGTQARARAELAELVRERLVDQAMQALTAGGALNAAAVDIVEGRTDPYTACERLLRDSIGNLRLAPAGGSAPGDTLAPGDRLAPGEYTGGKSEEVSSPDGQTGSRNLDIKPNQKKA